MSDIDLSISHKVATITLSRPPVNALNVSMIKALIDVLKTVDRDENVRAVILTGKGRCFSAGVDLREQLESLETGTAGPASLGVQMYDAFLNSRKPTIAAINGPALGAGLGMAASCCIQVASEDARVGIPEVNVGMLGGARHAMRLLGHSTVHRMLLTGHQLDGRELYHRRAVEACVPAQELMPYAMNIALEIASKDPVAVQMARQSLAEVEQMGVLEGYELEMALATDLGKRASARDAMRGFLTR